MSRTRLSFPVSSSQGMRNREREANLWAEIDLRFPKRIDQKSAPKKHKSGPSPLSDSNLAESRPIPTPALFLDIDRVYQPQAALRETLRSVFVSSVAQKARPTVHDRVSERGMEWN
jgi:hypothetical protein